MSRVAAKLEDPGIVRVHELLDRARGLVVIRELVEGESLDQLVARGPLDWRRAVRIGAELARIVTLAHEHGIVHRDVQPGNVLLEGAGARPRLADFEIARDFSKGREASGTTITEEGDLLGTLPFAAPEQVHFPRAAGPKADAYGVAAVVYYAIAGQVPFAGVPREEFMHAHCEVGPRPLADLARVPRNLSDVIARGMCPDFEKRTKVAELQRRLTALASE